MDAAAFFERYHGPLYHYVLEMVKDTAEAEDLTQGTLLRAQRRSKTLRNPNAIRGWLYRTATRVCLVRLRQRKPRCFIGKAEDACEGEPLLGRSLSVLELIERHKTSACLQHCLDFLPDSYRAVILLHEAHSLNANEIADLLGVTVATVKIRLHRARRMLEEIMKYACTFSCDSQGRPVCAPKSLAHS